MEKCSIQQEKRLLLAGVQSRTLLPLFTSSTVSLLKARLSHHLQKPASQAPLQTPDIPVAILENALWEGFCTFLLANYITGSLFRTKQDVHLCLLSAQLTEPLLQDFDPFHVLDIRAKASMYELGFQPLPSLMMCLFSMGRMIAIHRTDKWRDLMKQALDVVPHIGTAGQSVSVAFQHPCSQLGHHSSSKAWCKPHYMPGGSTKSERLCVCTEAQGTRQKLIRSAVPQCRAGWGTLADISWFLQISLTQSHGVGTIIQDSKQ